MSRKGQSITLSVSERDKAQLEALAQEFGKTWGDRPNISKLIEAIARRQLTIAPNHDWPQTRIQALDLARQQLLDLGKIDEALAIAQLLSDRSELTLPFRAQIDQFLSNPLPTWRQKIDNFIHRHQPFRLSYRDAADRLWSYTVLHARIVPIEKRQYLMCRCEESEGNQDVPGLEHNWTLLLDRIEDAAVISVDRTWLPDLDRISVEFHLFGRLAFNYRRKQGDVEVSDLEGDPPIRRVTRPIFNTFWFFREIAPYWEDCAIASPDSVRDRFQQKLIALCRQYNLEIRD
ncbi:MULTISPECIES: WYL domain-containing protein [unclassified Microcoleus]|uniref:WYL domain-containing protein n=1 Tax=unclassified Microcoleus TaxID=2642155 RepID=UPI002FD3086B